MAKFVRDQGERKGIFDGCSSGLFGDAVNTVVDRLQTVMKKSEAFQQFIPRRVQRPTALTSHSELSSRREELKASVVACDPPHKDCGRCTQSKVSLLHRQPKRRNPYARVIKASPFGEEGVLKQDNASILSTLSWNCSANPATLHSSLSQFGCLLLASCFRAPSFQLARVWFADQCLS